MARLRQELLDRIESFCHRTLDVVDALEPQRRSRKILDQMAAAGTSVGANVFEADQAMSRADFVRCLAIAVKELNETRFWIRLVGARGWLPAARLEAIQAEAVEIQRMLGAMIGRTRAADRRTRSRL